MRSLIILHMHTRVARYWNTVLRLWPTKTLRLLLIVFNWCLVSSTCVLWVTALKILRIIDAYLLCVLNPMVLHCNMLQYSAIYCISDIIDIWKSLRYQLLHTPVLRYWRYIEILPNPNAYICVAGLFEQLSISLTLLSFQHYFCGKQCDCRKSKYHDAMNNTYVDPCVRHQLPLLSINTLRVLKHWSLFLWIM